MKANLFLKVVNLSIIALVFISCEKNVVITSGNLQVEFDNRLYSKVNSLSPDTKMFDETFQLSEYLETKDFTTNEFKVSEVTTKAIEEKLGAGTETMLKGIAQINGVCLTKLISIKTYIDFPDMAFFNVSYINCGDQDLLIKRWVDHNYKMLSANDTPNFWSFQGSSSEERADWIKALAPGFYQENFMGMNQSDYGGGIPVTDIWRKDGGIAIGHVEMIPKEISLPVDYGKYSSSVNIRIEKDYETFTDLKIGDTLNTIQSFILVHTGDYYAALKKYSEFMQKKGIKFADTEDAAFESIWCGWGYMRKFTMDEFIGTLPKVKELGVKWAVIDDGFQVAEGDWRVDTKRFPGGAKDMKTMVDAIHRNGLKAKLWWAPLAADPGSKVLQEYPDALLINKAGSPQFITWWNSFYLSPASEATIKYTLETVEIFMKDWGFDGLKMDGQHMNAVPPDYNWERPLEYPEKSIEMLPELFKKVYETAREIKPHAVIENCPCGTCMSFYNMPYTNQTVASDPTSSWQIRFKGKTYKAIMPHTAYYGDHVELSDNSSDFASPFGVGAVLGTKFTWPEDNPYAEESCLLTPEKEVIWKKWFTLYDEKMLSKEEYLGTLYDIGYDKPETHVISKSDTLFYAFYSKVWDGPIELRGLEKGINYIAYDYVNNKKIAEFNGDSPQIKAAFEDYLLIEVYKN